MPTAVRSCLPPASNARLMSDDVSRFSQPLITEGSLVHESAQTSRAETDQPPFAMSHRIHDCNKLFALGHHFCMGGCGEEGCHRAVIVTEIEVTTFSGLQARDPQWES